MEEDTNKPNNSSALKTIVISIVLLIYQIIFLFIIMAILSYSNESNVAGKVSRENIINIGLLVMVILSLLGDAFVIYQAKFGYKLTHRWFGIFGYLLAILSMPIIFTVIATVAVH